MAVLSLESKKIVVEGALDDGVSASPKLLIPAGGLLIQLCTSVVTSITRNAFAWITLFSIDTGGERKPGLLEYVTLLSLHGETRVTASMAPETPIRFT